MLDTIDLDAVGVEAISGEKPRSPEFYEGFDKGFWAAHRAVSG